MPSINRRQLLLAVGSACAVGTAGCSSDDTPVADTTTRESADTPDGPVPTVSGTPPGSLPDRVTARRVASGFTAPVGFETVPGRQGQWVVVDQDGRVWLYDGDSVRDEPLLDVRDRMVSINRGYDERGLLGLAFHPEFAENGRLYARYSAPRRSGTPDTFSHTFVLSEFVVDGSRAPLDSERVVVEIPEPQSNHNAGAVTFGPDGYLYVGVGDGGGGGDSGRGHVEDWYDALPGGNGQDVTENRLGSILRIDVDGRDGDRGYAIPDDNPLVGRDGYDEHYAWGLRNPWRMSFDGSDLYAADVGQSAYEEVNLVTAGGNYGWNVREATHCYGTDECPAETPDGDPLVDPIVEYDHGGEPPNGVAVIGGYRYRGDALSGLEGTYVFSDWRLGGSLFVAQPREQGLWATTVLDAEAQTNELGSYALAFGRDTEDELYVCTTDSGGPSGDSGEVYKLTGTA